MRAPLLFVAFAVSCATAPASRVETGATPAAAPGRMGVHGMVVFGESRVFMSHIPMFRAPHDAQLVLEVELARPHASFADRLYTFEPAPFSLDALLGGTVREMKGTLYEGSFEDGGRPIAKDVRVTVTRTVVSRALGAANSSGAAQRYWLLGDRADAYLVHIVGATPSFDQVVRARIVGGDVLDDALLHAGKIVTVENRADDAAHRASPGTTLRAVGARAPFDVEPARELSCLVGPDFDHACP